MQDEGDDAFDLGGDVELVDASTHCNTPCPSDSLYYCGGDAATDVYVASE